MDFFCFLWIPYKVTKVTTNVTTENQEWLKMGQNSIIRSFYCPKGKKSLGRSPPQELEVGPRSGPYLQVIIIEIVEIVGISLIN